MKPPDPNLVLKFIGKSMRKSTPHRTQTIYLTRELIILYSKGVVGVTLCFVVMGLAILVAFDVVTQ